MILKAITQKHIAEFEKRIRAWKAEGELKNDKEMIKCYKDDRQGLRDVLSLIKKGKYKRAGWLIYRLDSIVRDQVPSPIYNFVMDYE